jgi:hypothetical protein
VIRYGTEQNIASRLTLIGRTGDAAKTWMEAWKKAGLPVQNLQEQPVSVISEQLSQAQIGITTSAWPMLEKSGTVAAMLDHRLPILCASPYKSRGKSLWQTDLPAVTLKPGCIKECLSLNAADGQQRSLQAVAHKFLKDLKEA